MPVSGLPESFRSTLQELTDLEQLIQYDNPNSYVLNESGAVIGLNLRSNEFADDDIRFLWELTELQALNLSDNQLSTVMIPASMQQLRLLNLSDNSQLTQLTFAAELPHLEWAELSNCKLESIVFPEGFSALETLYLQNNQLAGVDLSDSPSLKFLDLSGNQLTSLTLPAGFSQLAYLYLNDNALASLEILDDLPNLNILHLRKNKLGALPDRLLERTPGLQTLYLSENQLTDIPEDIIGGERNNCLPALKDYLRSQAKSRLRPLHQAKMILVGNGSVGKTSIRIKLKNKEAPLPKPKERTQGLDIETYTVKRLDRSLTNLEEPIDFHLNIWDFGGQGRYREVQQLFCSRKSLYLFVTACDDLPDKEDYIGFEYWLSMVNAYSYDQVSEQVSPVIHVVNKIDLEERLVNEADRKKVFDNISRFVKISCAKGLKNFDQLETAIREVLPEISTDVFTNRYTEFWLAVKQELEELRDKEKKHHIHLSEYMEICERNQLDAKEAMTWLEVLDRIGTVIFFGNNERLKDWIMLNPLWVKDAMYKVLDSPLVEEEAILKPAHYPYIWGNGYSPEEHEKLEALMLAYELCYPVLNSYGKTEYLVPALLPVEKPLIPHYLQIPTYQLKFEYRPFIPAGTVNKLMVRRHESIHRNLQWRNNVVLHDPIHHVYAHVAESWAEKTVYLDLFGEDAKTLYEFVRQVLEEVNDTLKHTKLIHHLELEAKGWHNDRWIKLRDLEALGIDFFAIKTKENISGMKAIRQLIAQGRLSVALEKLAQETPSGAQNEVTQLRSRLAELERGSRLGILSSAEVNLERNKITNNTLALINQIESGSFDQPASSDSSSESSADQASRILFIAANPSDQSRIQTDREHRLLKAEMERGRLRDRFAFLPPQFAVTIHELVRAMNDQPQIIHFAGHGAREGIVITTEDNRTQIMPAAALKRLFRPLRGITEVVVLNACYSAEQAKVISEFGMYVVGNNLPITDAAAISFSRGFYNGLGEGKDFASAYNDAMTVVLTENAQAADIIEVWKDGNKLDL